MATTSRLKATTEMTDHLDGGATKYYVTKYVLHYVT